MTISKTPVYLDSNATTAPLPAVVEAVAAAMAGEWANPSSKHGPGDAARARLGAARATIAAHLGCKPAQIVFTSGATEANAMALAGAAARAHRPRVLVSAAEHAGLLAFARRMPDVGVLPLNRDGSLDLAAAVDAIDERVSLVSVMAANNETGVLMPIEALAQAAHARGALLHVDATQRVGKLGFDFSNCGADLASVSAHKLHGPKGIGALLVGTGIAWPALLPGAQERGRRGGTENLPAIAGFAAAARAVLGEPALLESSARVTLLRDRLERELARAVPGVEVYGRACERLPNTSCMRFGRVPAEVVLTRLERAGVVASSGSACSSGGTEPSHVLLAMGVPAEAALAAVRFSLSGTTTRAQIDDALAAAVPVLRAAVAEHVQAVPAFAA